MNDWVNYLWFMCWYSNKEKCCKRVWQYLNCKNMNSQQLIYYVFSLKIIQPPKNLFFNHIVWLKSSHIRGTDMLSLINIVNSHLFTENGISFNSGKLRLLCIFNYCNLIIIKSTRINLSYVNYCLFTFKLHN